ncbi:hypothetical protein AK812_SmicGene28919 [Symbiodinium microadriaticum]|uniref:Uncharacterized protein n=1 Tax=Symbiodinium microadriaticum TaxID=2951 RepID=A0A1Q9D349_SYMMI|nr:hypothetical protein AK812_SmicGene28919 [Symbiodinium microadriaticum]
MAARGAHEVGWRLQALVATSESEIPVSIGGGGKSRWAYKGNCGIVESLGDSATTAINADPADLLPLAQVLWTPVALTNTVQPCASPLAMRSLTPPKYLTYCCFEPSHDLRSPQFLSELSQFMEKLSVEHATECMATAGIAPDLNLSSGSGAIRRCMAKEESMNNQEPFLEVAELQERGNWENQGRKLNNLLRRAWELDSSCCALQWAMPEGLFGMSWPSKDTTAVNHTKVKASGVCKLLVLSGTKNSFFCSCPLAQMMEV